MCLGGGQAQLNSKRSAPVLPGWKGGTPATVVIGKIAFEFPIRRLDTLISAVEDIKTEISINSPSGIESSLSDIQSRLFKIQMAVEYPKI